LSAPKKPVYGLMPNPVWASVALPRYRPEPESVSCSRAGCDLPLKVTVPSMAPPLDPASPAAQIVAEIARRLEAGLDPAEVAARVLAAIRHDELYIFTHPNMREEVDARFAAIQGAMDRASAS
jgi:hypothetical protein